MKMFEERLDALLQEPRRASALDLDPERHRTRCNPRSGRDDIAELLLGAQLVEGGFVYEVHQEREHRPQRVVGALAELAAVR